MELEERVAVGGTKARIQQAALELFVRNGYEKTSLREIADQLGVTKAALYYHYASKQDLLKSITQPLFDECQALLDRRLEPRELLTDYLDLLTRNRPVFEIFATDHAALVAAELAERSLGMRTELVRQVAGPDPSPHDLVRAASALGAVLQGFSHATRLDPSSEPLDPDTVYPAGEELRDLLIDAAFRVLRRN